MRTCAARRCLMNCERAGRMKRKLYARFGRTSHKELEGALVNTFHRCYILVSVANVF
jgi:hypothetical protein